MIEAGAQRGFLAEVARQRERADASVAQVRRHDRRERGVGAAVVDEQDFPPAAVADVLEYRAHSLDEGTIASSSFLTGAITDRSGATRPRLMCCARRSATDGGDVITAFLRWAVTRLSVENLR